MILFRLSWMFECGGGVAVWLLVLFVGLRVLFICVLYVFCLLCYYFGLVDLCCVLLSLLCGFCLILGVYVYDLGFVSSLLCWVFGVEFGSCFDVYC